VTPVTVTITFTPSQVMALATLVGEHMRMAGHTEVFIDAVRCVETTPEDLLKILLDAGRGASR
jgi:hypothetical protein